MKLFGGKTFCALMLAISGAVTALPLIFSELGFVQWLSLVPMAIVLVKISKDKEMSLKKIYLAGVLFFECYFLVVYHWFLAMYPLEFTGISRPVAVFVVLLAWIGLSLLSSLVYALIFLAFAVIARMTLMQGARSAFVMPIVAAALWTAFEWIQTLAWWGVPWGRLCLGQINASWLIESASYLGSYFVSFVIVVVNFYLASALAYKPKRELACALCALALFCLNLTLGFASDVTYRDGADSVCFAAVQGNNPNSNGWDEDSFDRVMEVHSRLTKKAARQGAEIVLWSETAFPYNYFEAPELMDKVTVLAVENDVTILVSAFTESEVDDVLYVSLIEVRPDGTYGEVEYHKQKLVPFGEYVPMKSLLVKLIPPLGELKTLEDDLVAGKESTVIESELCKIGAAICYDSIYEETLRASVNNGAEVLVVTTNDSWFGSSAALDMHNAQARLRAIETGRYVVRSANTGISSVISPKGEIMQSLEKGKEGFVIDDVCLNEHNTVYSVIGNAFVYVSIVFIAALVIAEAVFKKSRHRDYKI